MALTQLKHWLGGRHINYKDDGTNYRFGAYVKQNLLRFLLLLFRFFIYA